MEVPGPIDSTPTRQPAKNGSGTNAPALHRRVVWNFLALHNRIQLVDGVVTVTVKSTHILCLGICLLAL